MINIILKLFSLLLFSAGELNEDVLYSNSELLGYREGYVGNESFNYYYVHYSGNILISLTTSNGDADLYISENKIHPNFYPENYDLHSATCGVEIIEIPTNFKSPLAIGVYGHSSHDLSGFVLEIFKVHKNQKAFAVIEDEIQENNEEIPKNSDNNNKVIRKRKNEKISSRINGFLSFFEILGLVFL